MSEEFTVVYISACEASEQCIASGWYLSIGGYIQLGEHAAVPFETESSALEYVRALADR